MPQGEDGTGAGERRFVIAAGTSDYQHAAQFPHVSSVAKSVELIARRLAELGYCRALVEVSHNPTAADFLTALRKWVLESDRHEDDLLVFYYCGHGTEQASQYYLATHDSRFDDIDNTALETGRLTNTLLKGLKAGQVLLILDACYAGEGAFAVCGRALDLYRALGPRESTPAVYVVATARRMQEATPGAFPRAFEKTLWSERNAPTLQFLTLDWVVATINAALRQDCPTQMVENLALRPPGEWRLLPNPAFDARARDGEDLATARRRRDFPDHWIPRARGAEFAAQAWYFTGRTRVLKEIVGWLNSADSGPPICVVTGGAGTGKSAVLGRLVTLADPEIRASISASGDLAAIAVETLPPERIIDAPVLARDKTADEVVHEIASALGLKTAGEAELVQALKERRQRTVIVLDALDEAKAPKAIAELVRDKLAPLPGLKILVGTRPDAPASASGRTVRGLGESALIKDLDDREVYLAPEDVGGYVERRLLAADDPNIATPYRDNPALARTVAAAVAAKANGVFLVARIVSDSLIAEVKPTDVAVPGWPDRLPGDIGSAFEADLARFDAQRYRPLTKAKVTALLRPLAYAEGAGLPWGEIWARLANVLADASFEDQDIEALLRHAGAYIVAATESGALVYRLYHEALAEHLRDPEWEKEAQTRITRALIDVTPDRLDDAGKDWRPGQAHAYVRTHLASHAARAKMLEGLVADPLFLACAEPSRLSRVIGTVQSPEACAAAAVYELAEHWLENIDAAERALRLRFTALRERQLGLADRLGALPLAAPWQLLWARLTSETPNRRRPGLKLGSHGGVVRALALGSVAGRAVLLSAGVDGVVRRWDAKTGAAIGEPLLCNGHGVEVLRSYSAHRDFSFAFKDEYYEHRGGMYALALGDVAGNAVIVTVGADGTIRRWEAGSGAAIGVPIEGCSGELNAVALGEVKGRAVIITSGEDGTVRRWDAKSGEAIGAPLRIASPEITAVALGQLGGRTIIVAANHTFTRVREERKWVAEVQQWDAETGSALGAPITLLGPWGKAVALGKFGVRDVIALASSDDKLLVWDAKTGAEISASIEGYFSKTDAVAVVCLPREIVIFTGNGDEGWIRRWSGQEDSYRLIFRRYCCFIVDNFFKLFRTGISRHPRPSLSDSFSAGAIVLGEIGGRTVLVTSSGAGQRWDARTGEIIGPPLKKVQSDLMSLGLGKLGGRDVIISGGRDGTVRRWDGEKGTEIGMPLRGHRDWVNSVTLGRIYLRAVIVSGSNDGTVRQWDGETGAQIGAPLTGHRNWVTAVALGQVDGTPVIISGDEDGTLRRWDARTGAVIGERLKGHRVRITSVAVGSVQARCVIVSSGFDGTIRRFDAESGEAIGPTLRGHSGWAKVVVDGSLIVSGGADGIVRRWDMLTGAEAGAPIFLDFRVCALAVSGDLLAVAGDRGILVFDLAAKTRTLAVPEKRDKR